MRIFSRPESPKEVKIMPVGSCLGGQIDNNEANLEVIMTSSVLNQADQFAFMQQTLLMQVINWFLFFVFWKGPKKPKYPKKVKKKEINFRKGRIGQQT